MAEFKISRGMQTSYNAMASRNADTIYVCTDTGRCYLGDKFLSPRLARIYTSGKRVYYNGNDVTDSEDLESIVNSATSEWFGSQGAYDELVDGGAVLAGVLYNIEVQPDWEETDPSHLGFVKNMPDILDMEYVGNDNEIRLFYTRHNQEVPYQN